MTSPNGILSSNYRLKDSTSTVFIIKNNGTPEGVVSSNAGSLCLDTTAGDGKLYIKQSGSGNTGWVLFVPEPVARWVVDTTSPISLESNINHFATTTLIDYKLPSTSFVGETFMISDPEGFLFTVSATQPGQYIQHGATKTATGVGTNFASTGIGDSVELVCFEIDKGFLVVDSIGNFEVNT